MNISYEPVQLAMEMLGQLSADEEVRHLAFVRERALRDEVSLLCAARDEGKTEGKAEMLLSLLKSKYGELPNTVVARINDASIEDIEHWSSQLFTAQTIEAVLADRGK